MARYIDASKVTIPEGFFENLNVPKLLKWLSNQPTADAVEVVRCRDCKLRDTEGCPFMVWDCGELMGDTEDNDYCSYGKRKE